MGTALMSDEMQRPRRAALTSASALSAARPTTLAVRDHVAVKGRLLPEGSRFR
jgi:hypothetical protein